MITNAKHFSQVAGHAFLASCTIISLLFTAFFIAEPSIGHGQSDSFYIRQTITSENSIVVLNDVTMVGDLNGVTGGNATGTTQFVVTSNNATGYFVQISFADDDLDGEAMNGDETDTGEIRNYYNPTAEPTFDFTASSAAQFAYTVTSDNGPDTDQSFLDNATICNSSGGSQLGRCWKSPTTGNFTIVNRSSAATTGATSTIQFKVHVPSGAVPIPQAQTYTATATLSLTQN